MASAREALLAALAPYIESIGDALVAETVKRMLEVECTFLIQLAARDELRNARRDVLPGILDEIIGDIVRQVAPGVAMEYIREETERYMYARKIETAYDLLLHEAAPEWLRGVADDAVVEVREAETWAEALDAVLHEVSSELAASCLAADEARRVQAAEDDSIRAVRETAEQHVLTKACLRHLTGLLSSRSTSLMVHRALHLKACHGAVRHLDGVLRATVDLRDRMEEEDLLADCFKATAADVGIEILKDDLSIALTDEEAAIQAREDAAYQRSPPPPPVLSPTVLSPKQSAFSPNGARGRRKAGSDRSKSTEKTGSDRDLDRKGSDRRFPPPSPAS